jgi:hypothetical protein
VYTTATALTPTHTLSNSGPALSDVLPWQCMTRYPNACHGAKFIDIDFPDLMSKKRAIVLNTPELSSVFEPLDTTPGEHVFLKSEMYSQIGCDLRNTTDIEKALSICLGQSDCTFMFVAEVSITYMEVRPRTPLITLLLYYLNMVCSGAFLSLGSLFIHSYILS